MTSKKTSQAQFEIMVNFFEKCPSLLSRKVDPTFPKQFKYKKWAELCQLLNSESSGPQKEVKDWLKTLKYWKCHVKKKLALSIEARQLTASELPPKDELTPVESKLVSMMRHVGEIGQESIAKSPVVHDKEEYVDLEKGVEIKEEPEDNPNCYSIIRRDDQAKHLKKGLERGDSYQTVTVVPSDTNPGELSYVRFNSKADDGSLDGNDGSIDGNDTTLVVDLNSTAQNFEKPLTKQAETNRLIRQEMVRLAALQSQMDMERYVCEYCSYTTSKRYLMSRHLKSCSDERPHKCGECGRGFKTFGSLQNHINTHRGTRPHPCKECDSCFTTKGELVRHVRSKHMHETPNKCTECEYATFDLSRLKRHMRRHTGERPYQCPHCTYASTDKYKLKCHLLTHTKEKPYECDICQTGFTHPSSLKVHQLIHSGNKPVFQCEKCPSTCGSRKYLRIHMEKLHASDKRHRCKKCGKEYLDQYSYKIHVKSHKSEKCFKCDLCNDYTSKFKRDLETHMLVHADLKPFKCDECDMSFRQKHLLTRHTSLYHDPSYVRPKPKEKTHVCEVCHQAFGHKGNLLRHISERESSQRLCEPKQPAEGQGGEKDEESFDGISDKEDQQENEDDLLTSKEDPTCEAFQDDLEDIS